jgi:cytochrome c-type biogenesis protein CcmH
MLMLIVLAALLTGASLWWLTRPLRATVRTQVDSERADLEQLRDRLIAQLNELDAERADRGIEAGVADEEELRLSAELAEALKRLESRAEPVAASAGSDGRRRGAWMPVVALSALVLTLGAGLYFLQNGANLKGFWSGARSGGATAGLPPAVYEMVSRLEKRLAEQPNDATGWARLGRSYMVLKRTDDALGAYAKAYALSPDSPEILADYAWVLFNSNPQVLTGQVADLYGRLQKLVPDHPDALWFLGMAAYQQGDFRKSLEYWEHLMRLLPPDEPGRQQLQKFMDSARERSGSQRR